VFNPVFLTEGGIMFGRLPCLVAVCLFITSANAAAPPRYQLPVGRVIHYSGEGSSTERDANVPRSTSKFSWRFTVIAHNPDGSARVLARSSTSYSHRGDQSEPRVSSAVIDLYPDGRYRIDPSLAMTLSPQTVFGRLPADAEQAAKQWQSDVDWTGNRTTFTPQGGGSGGAGGGAGEFVFTGVQEGPINRIYVMTQKSTFHFGKAKGLVTRVDTEHSQDYGFHSKGTGTLKLDKEETLPADQAAALARDYAAYTEAVKSYRDEVKGLDKQPEKAQQIIDTARLTLSAAAEKVQHPDVKQEFKTKLQEHDQYSKYSIEQAKRLAEVLNKPAADWAAKDLNDQPVSAKSLRGKVVVMDFWYRGCGWCMYAMPQVKRLAADFKDKPVAVLGMNTDRNLDDARFVVKELGLDYPQVQATGIPEKFGVQAFPTLIIIDQEGAVRDVHVGYSPDLYDTVSKKIEALLSGKAAG
jgi:thiol-disulfide isomerase/thioredoxin